MYKVFILMALMSLSSTTLAGEIYRCIIDGQVEYSRAPCEDDSGERMQQLEQIQASPKPSNLRINAVSNPNKVNKSDGQHEVEIHILNNKIKRSYKEIEKYQTKMRREIKKIKDKTYYASNNNAGSNYLNALSNEMTAVSAKYKIYIDLERDTIKSYREEITYLKQQ